MVVKVLYFRAPGRAEPARLILAYGGVPFEDVFPDWPAAKADMPFGQMPVLELDDGRRLAQSGAINRYCAQLAGLLPKDPWQAALADQAAFVMSDFRDLTAGPIYRVPQEERAAKAAELLAGAAKVAVGNLEKLMASLPTGKFVAGDEPCWADLEIFANTAAMVSGMLGMGPDMLDAYPHWKAHYKRVGNLPAVRKAYEDQGDTRGPTFRPDP